ncbi:MAG: hypothetical protein KKH83_05450 [Candidatus Margulisbacteria bacterium]|nr:hypothetical protein [Candidatus Margulisiibacteriota bacterium]
MKKSKFLKLGVMVTVIAFGLNISASFADLQIISDINGYLSEFLAGGSTAEWEQDAQPIGATYWIYSGTPTVKNLDGSFTYQRDIYLSPTFREGNLTGSFWARDIDMQLETGARLTALCTYYPSDPSATFTPTIPNQLRIFGCQYTIPAAAVPGFNSFLQLADGQAMVTGSDVGSHVQDAFRPPLQITFTEAEPPRNFNGPGDASNVNGWTDQPVGNTVSITWSDINGTAPTIFATDKTPPITYDIYMHADEDFNPGANGDESRRVATSLTGNVTNPPLGGNGVPGAVQMSDNRNYYFRMRAKDSVIASARDTLDRHKTTYTDGGVFVRSVMPHDYTPPHTPTAPENIGGSGNVSDRFLRVSWTNPGDNDFVAGGGLVVLRKIGGGPEGAPDLGGASGTEHGPAYTAGQDLGGGWTVYQLLGSGASSFTEDSTVENGQRYHYAIYAYDAASDGAPTASHTFQQGRNYSTPAVTSGTPGVEPSVVRNFVALTGPTEPLPALTLNWTNAPEDYYGGALIFATTDVTILWDITPYSFLQEPDPGSNTPNRTNVFLLGRFPPNPDTAPSNAITVTQINGANIDPETPYYFKAFAYNAGTDADWDPTNSDALNAHLFSAGEIAGDRILPAGAGGVGGIYSYNLRQYSSSHLAINSITVPAVENLAATVVLGGVANPTLVSDSVTSAQALIGLVNEAAGRPVVTVLSRWNAETGKGMGLTYNPAGNTYTGENFTLAPGEGYQIFVTEDVNLVLEARRAE